MIDKFSLFMKKLFITIIFFAPILLQSQVVTSYLEFVKVTNVNYTFKTVSLGNTYTDPIIVCTYVLPSSTDNEAVVRIDNITASSFQVKIQQPNDSSSVTASDVHCIISEEGSYTAPILYEAHKVTSTGTSGQAAPNNFNVGNTQDVSGAIINTYTAPAVLGQVMSYNDSNFSAFWSFDCDDRRNPPFDTGMADGICVGKNVGQVPEARANETLGYIVAQSGIYELANYNMEIGVGADSVRGVGDTPPYSYTLDKTYDFGIATAEAMDGGQGGWAVMYGTSSLAGSQIDLAFDEETVAGDTSRGHTTEEVAYWTMSRFEKTYADMQINEIMYQQTVTSPANEEFMEFYVTSAGSILNWMLTDQDGVANEYIFPDQSVNVGDYVILHSGAGTDSSSGGVHHYYMGLDWTLDNIGDDITLLKPSNDDWTTINGNKVYKVPVDYVSYFSSAATSIDAVPISENGVTVAWNSSEQLRLGSAVGLTSISLTPNATDSDTSLCWEWTATSDVTRQALNCPGYKPTNDINTNAGFIDSIAFSNTDLPPLADMIINEIMYRQTADGPANEEFMEFYVTSSGSILNFILSDQDGTANEYHFPNLSVSTGDYVILHSGVGTDSSAGGIHHFYMGTNWTLNNAGDDITLLKPVDNDDWTTINGNRYRVVPVDYVSYFVSATTDIDAIPVSEDGVTVSWDISEYARLGGTAILTSISLTPNASDSDTSLCWEWTATSIGAQKATNCTGYIPTKDTNTNAGFIDSVTVANTDVPDINLSKSVSTIYDPVNLLINPKSIPGSIKEYVVTSFNIGLGSADTNSTVIFDTVPNDMTMCVSNVIECKTPVFIDGAVSSTLSLGLVEYSNNSGVTYVYSPSADINGFDDNVTNIKVNLNGSFAPSNGVNHPSFQVKLRMGVK